ncbi:MAG: peptide chain release factor 2 [Planctomycetes bacterium]|nr:peptide chain release factor 2 [Planctomycetota bacterium]MCB9872421.1 peptide chain release factor 2 [Planctomycetota bacterium]MCB9888378.1 peptide chain release factor 2 [Planctomycetota bacterium]
MSLSEHRETLREASNRIDTLKVSLDYETALRRLRDIEHQMTQPGFWDNPERAQEIVLEKKRVGGVVTPLDQAGRLVEDGEVLLDLGADDPEAVEADIVDSLTKLDQILDKLEFQLMLGGEHDAGNAIMTLVPGAGGIDAADWAEMLMRMYVKWGDANGYEMTEEDRQMGEEAGIRTATIHFKGPFAYGHLKAEQGVHRLVRISPFDGNARRQTSFASVEVVPELEDGTDVEIDEGDLRIDTYRASGAGGQHVNKTESAVRITHIPTGIVVQCQNERSQHKNRASAMKALRGKLFQLEQAKREEELAKFYGERGSVSWGNQIRSYVQHPYQMVKDLRTGLETSNIDSVLDGDIDDFIVAYLKKRRG